MEDVSDAVYDQVRTVPEGKVVTYGQVADMIHSVAVGARQVGGIMSAAPPGVPWWRVVGAGGTLPIGKRDAALMMIQRNTLEREGVEFDGNGRVLMHRFQWLPNPSAQGAFDLEG